MRVRASTDRDTLMGEYAICSRHGRHRLLRAEGKDLLSCTLIDHNHWLPSAIVTSRHLAVSRTHWIVDKVFDTE